MNRFCLGLLTWVACVKGGKQEEVAQQHEKAEGATSTALPQGDDGPPVSGGQIIVHLEAEPPHLGYFINPDAWTRRITVPLVYDTLIQEDPKTYEYTPALAERWEVSTDSLTYTFHLRKGVRWHDGQPFSAKDVKFTFDKLFDPSVRAQSLRGSFEPFCSKWDAPDEFTFVLRCHKPYFLLIASLADLPIMPQHVFSVGDFNKHENLRKPIGTGPYKFASWKPRHSIVLGRNDDYYGKKGYLDRIVYQFVEDPNVAVQLAKKGEIDFMARVREAQWFGMKDDPVINDNFNKITDWPNAYSYTVFNLQRPIFSDVRTRKAIAHLFDQQRILETIMYNQARRTTSPYYSMMPNYHKKLPHYDFNPDKAKALLAEAGWKDSDGDGVLDKNGAPLRFSFLVTIGASTMQKWVTLFQEDLRKAGIAMEIAQIEWATFLERLRKHNFDLGALISITPRARVDVYESFHSSQIADGQNYSSYRSQKVDALLDQIRSTLDDAARIPLELRLQEILHEDLPIIFNYNHANNAILHKRFRGAYTTPMWYQLKEFWIPKSLQAASR